MKVQPIEAHAQQAMPMEGASGVKMRMLVGPAEGATKFHMRQFEVEAGGHTPHHSHDYEHEILILAGRGVAVSEQGERALRAGDVVWVAPKEKHQFRNAGDETFKFICLIPAPMDCSK